MDVPIIDGKQLEEVVIKAKKSFEKMKIRMGINYPFADKTIDDSQLLSVPATSTFRAIQLLYPFINVRIDNFGMEYPERRSRRAGVIVDGFGLPEGAMPPNIESILRIDIVSGKDTTIYIYTRNGLNTMRDDKPKPFEGNAFLRGFDVVLK